MILYILENRLEDVNIFDSEFFKCFPTIGDVAVAFNVGTATVEAWIENDCLKAIEAGDVTYILPSSLDKFAEKMSRREVKNV